MGLQTKYILIIFGLIPILPTSHINQIPLALRAYIIKLTEAYSQNHYKYKRVAKAFVFSDRISSPNLPLLQVSFQVCIFLCLIFDYVIELG